MTSECHLDKRRYTDQSFDQEFFTVLQRASLQCIHTAGSATLDEIATYLRDKVNDAIALPPTSYIHADVCASRMLIPCAGLTQGGLLRRTAGAADINGGAS